MGNWTPDTITYQELIRAGNLLDDVSRTYPFYLAYPLEDDPNGLGSPKDWQVERKWDGIRSQLIVRDDNLFVWSRGEELVTDKFPEYHPLAQIFPNGTVIDGEIFPFINGLPLSFNVLQTRIGRKNIIKKNIRICPVILMAYDLLENEGTDLRQTPLKERRALLEKILAENPTNGIIILSEIVEYNKIGRSGSCTC